MSWSARDMMWSEALTILARSDRVRQDVFSPTADGWEPAIDVLETELGLLAIVALPGVRREDMQLAIVDGALLVRGVRRWPTLPGPARVHRVELPHGRFERQVRLPPGTFQLGGTDHVDGCLNVTLRRLA